MNKNEQRRARQERTQWETQTKEKKAYIERRLQEEDAQHIIDDYLKNKDETEDGRPWN